MNNCKTILYIHGMGGGGDSRIPAILKDVFNRMHSDRNIDIVIKTYNFNPEEAAKQIKSWVVDFRPVLVIGESLGSIHAIRIKGIPHILISPSLGAPGYFGHLAFLSLIPGVRYMLNKIYKPRSGDRQVIDFKYNILKKYIGHEAEALKNTPVHGSNDVFYAFFGTQDHYRKTGVVSIRKYVKYFGNTYEIYDGTHFMEERNIYEKLIPKIFEFLDND